MTIAQIKQLFRTLISETKIGIAWPTSALGAFSMLSDVLNYRSYAQNTINLYQKFFRDPFADLIDNVVRVDIPAIWVDYAIACSICFTILNWSRRRTIGRDHVTNLLFAWRSFIRYFFSLSPFREATIKKSPFPTWIELPVMTLLTVLLTVSFPVIFLLSPVLLIIGIFTGVADVIPRRAGLLLPPLYFRIVGMSRMVTDPELWSPLDEWKKQDMLRRLKEKTADWGTTGKNEYTAPPHFRSHWDIEDFFGTRGRAAITRNTDIAIELQRDIMRDGAIAALRATIFSVSAFFVLIAISVDL